VSFAAITLYVASQRVFIVVIYFVIDSVRKLVDTPSYTFCIASLELDYCLAISLHSDLRESNSFHKCSEVNVSQNQSELLYD
jgi:hypothetical protein